jgi:acetate kinase
MGFTPTGGIVMATRSGDLDPGVLLYLARTRGLDPDAISRAVNVDGGLAGLSGTTGDMRTLLDRSKDDPRAAEAVEVFCYQVRKAIGAFAATLGGVDAIVFTGGIGEHAATVRARVCETLAWCGVRLDDARNIAHAPVISSPGAPVTVRIVPTNEELMIARHMRSLLQDGGTRGTS